MNQREKRSGSATLSARAARDPFGANAPILFLVLLVLLALVLSGSA
jgi:hypothetical protein